eukprot:480266-Pyramimonas_sp.AAC.1
MARPQAQLRGAGRTTGYRLRRGGGGGAAQQEEEAEAEPTRPSRQRRRLRRTPGLSPLTAPSGRRSRQT